MANVLVLEDDPTLASFIQLSLEEDGHFVRVCTSAATALERFKQDRFDLVVSDIIIKEKGRPVADGGISLIWRIKQAARAEGRRVPVIAISGSYSNPGMQDILTTAETIGADKVLKKPFDPDDLLDAVRDLLAPAQAVSAG